MLRESKHKTMPHRELNIRKTQIHRHASCYKRVAHALEVASRGPRGGDTKQAVFEADAAQTSV
jgi:hypothetical protein